MSFERFPGNVSGLQLKIENQDVLLASLVPLYVENALLFTPFDTFSSARLSSARSLPGALARSSRARIARRAAAGADSLDIYMHTRYHSGEQSTRGTRTKRVSLCSPFLLRSRERKEERKLKETSVLTYLRPCTQNLRREKSEGPSLRDIAPQINCSFDQSISTFCAMTSPFVNGKRKYNVKSPRWTSGSDLRLAARS